MQYSEDEKKRLYKRNYRNIKVVLISIIIIQLLYILKQTL